jgi:nucleotide-binding universal stress UspA family protein
MTFRTMLVHLDDSPACERRIDTAARLARRFDSRLAGVYLVATGELTPSVAALLPPAVVEQRLSETCYAQDRAEVLFRRTVASMSPADVEFRAPAGAVMEAALVHARCGDLTILGQSGGNGDDHGFAHRLSEHVMLGSGAPILLVPYASAATEPGSNVVIAWDGGREAARAVRDALPFLGGAARVTVVSATADRDAAERMSPSHARLGDYLSAHGIAAQFKRTEGAGSEAAERLLSQASDLGADLIVMGGYAHARAREYVLGGVTRSMLGAMTVPVLMSH